MAQVEPLSPRRAPALALLLAGCLALAAGVAFGEKAAPLGAAVFLAAILLAIRGASKPLFTWTNGLIVLVAVVWLVPIKLYRLPIDLPFGAEIYRFVLAGLLLVLLVAVVLGRQSVRTGGQTASLLLLVAVATVSQVLNAEELSTVAADDPTKALSTLLAFLVAFVLVCSVLTDERQIDTIIGVLVAGGAIVAVFALVEGMTAYNVFNQLGSWLPGFVEQPRDISSLRGGRSRVFASAQHPIALGCAMTLMIPLALYLASRARAVGRWIWMGAALLLGASALATVSRTAVVMVIGMIVIGVWLRGAAIARFWPILLVLPVVAHLVTPGAIGGLWKSFFPEEGLASELGERAGEGGSGRFADFDPAFILWEQSPVVGKGLGALAVPRDDPGLPVPSQDPTVPTIIFDDQYLTTFVELGVIGLIALVWFVWGASLKISLAARRQQGHARDRLAACAASCGGFAVSLFVFDTFAFIQCTLLFFIVAALGLRARELSRRPTPEVAR